MGKKPITLFANREELRDFELIKRDLLQTTDAGAIRAMIVLCKKNLHNSLATASKKSKSIAK